jgi:hypothetical protein
MMDESMSSEDCRGVLQGALIGLALLAGLASAAAAQPCPTSRTITRSIEAWYGSVFANSTSLADRLELTDHIAGDVALAMQADLSVDPRVNNNTGPWVNGQTGIEWPFGTPENLPAEGNLRTVLSSVPLPPPLNAVRFDPAINRGAQTYTLFDFVSTEDCAGTPIQVRNTGFAEVTYFELNATAVVGAAAPALSE